MMENDMPTKRELSANGDEMPLAPRQGDALTISQLVNHVKLVHDVMRAAMTEGVHYGIIPGCDKPSLYQPGAELLATTFRIAVEPAIVREETTDGEYGVLVRATARHAQSGIFLGEHLGYCSTREERHAWRRAMSKEEFDATSAERRRVRKRRGKAGGYYEEHQIRQSVGDKVHVILMIAQKRARVAVIRAATAASEIFTQDIEELPQFDVNGEASAATAPAEAPKRVPAKGNAPAKPQPEPIDAQLGTLQEALRMKEGDKLQVCAEVVAIEEKRTRQGAPYCIIALAADGAQLTASQWQAQKEFEQVGSWISGWVEANMYRGEITWSLHNAEPAEPGTEE